MSYVGSATEVDQRTTPIQYGTGAKNHVSFPYLVPGTDYDGNDREIPSPASPVNSSRWRLDLLLNNSTLELIVLQGKSENKKKDYYTLAFRERNARV